MAVTTNYSGTLPTVGASASTWGAENNTLHQLWDTTLFGMLPKAGGTLTGALVAAVGTVLLPSLTFAGDLNTGFYYVGADSFGLALGGVNKITYSAAAATYLGMVPVGPTPAAGAAGYASFRLPHGVAPTTNLTNGDIWTTSALLQIRMSAATKTIAFTDSNITGSAASATGNAATATALVTGYTISGTGDVTFTTGTFNGSGNVTGVCTIGAAKVTMAMLANIATSSVIGRVAASPGVPKALSAAELSGLVDLSSATIGTGAPASDYVKLGSIYIQWGSVSVTASNVAGTTGEGTVTFPVTFPTALKSIVATAIQPSGAEGSSNTQVPYINDQTTAGCTIGLDSNGGTPTFTVNWVAFGY